jgi:dihydroorotate dehydrogenase
MIYKGLIRPLLFKMYAENVHHLIKTTLKFSFAIPGVKYLVSSYYKVEHPGLEREVFGLKFKNPVGIAAGFDKNAEMYNEMAAFGFGHIEIGTVTPLGQAGNPQPRIFRLIPDQAMINRMGFNNGGIDLAVENLRKRKTDVIIGGNLGKNTATPNATAVDDYLKVFEGLFDVVDYFVVNVSCPNVTDLCELQDQDFLEEILFAVQQANQKKSSPKPVLLKVAPDLNEGQLDEVIEIVAKTKIDGVIATNTTVTRDDLKSDWQSIGNGGLSGAPLKNKSTEVIRYLATKSKKAFPIIGVGGIFTAEDAIEKLEAGADLVQVYTGFIYEGPAIAKRINKAILKKYS